MSRIAVRRARPLPIRRKPDGLGVGERAPFEDPRGPGQHDTLPYRQATELLRCIQIMGADSDAYCRHEVLGEPIPPQPEFRDVAGISSPVPFAATVAADGSASASVNGIPVQLLPDANSADAAMTNRAETEINVAYTGFTYNTLNGRVTNLTVPSASITIQTTYGPGASSGMASGYGRGTTAADVAAGNTSLGFHEGRHGVDYLRFIAANRAPRFTGAVGMTEAQVKAAFNAYKAGWVAYIASVKHQSTHNTDCVGNIAAASAAVQVICRHSHPPGARP